MQAHYKRVIFWFEAVPAALLTSTRSSCCRSEVVPLDHDDHRCSPSSAAAPQTVTIRPSPSLNPLRGDMRLNLRGQSNELDSSESRATWKLEPRNKTIKSGRGGSSRFVWHLGQNCRGGSSRFVWQGQKLNFAPGAKRSGWIRPCGRAKHIFLPIKLHFCPFDSDATACCGVGKCRPPVKSCRQRFAGNIQIYHKLKSPGARL